MIVKHVGVFSLAKVAGVLYGLMGLIFGAIVSLISLVGAAFGPSDFGPFGFLFGVGSFIFLPIFYGFFGFVGGALTAAIYNIVVGIVGGIEIVFESEPQQSPQATT